jgi:hypothetical protein
MSSPIKIFLSSKTPLVTFSLFQADKGLKGYRPFPEASVSICHFDIDKLKL